MASDIASVDGSDDVDEARCPRQDHGSSHDRGRGPVLALIGAAFIVLLQRDLLTGAVVAASGNIEGESALVRPEPAPPRAQISTLSTLPIGTGERFRVLRRGREATEQRTIVVALSLAPVDEAVQSARSLLLEVLPAALSLTALVTWLGVGRALAPVERIRREVATIGAGDLSKRVPLSAAHDEVHRLGETMNSMLDRLEAAAGRRAVSSPTPPTSCAAHWRTFGPPSKWPWPVTTSTCGRRPGKTSRSRTTASDIWSRICSCWRAWMGVSRWLRTRWTWTTWCTQRPNGCVGTPR